MIDRSTQWRGVLALLMVFAGYGTAQASDDAPQPWTKPVPRATCGPGARAESGLQGSTTLAERFGGASAQGFSCNMQLVGQTQGEGASWQMAWSDTCAYYDTANGAHQAHYGVVVVDVSDPAHPKPVDSIDSPTMRDPWESLHVNAARKLLGGAEAENGTGTGNGFEIYDVSDCRHPVRKATLQIADSHGHAGNWTQDGQFYYVTQGFRGIGGSMPIVDTADPTNPKLVTTWKFEGNGRPHDTNSNADGTRMYSPQPGYFTAPVGSSSFGPEGLIILDTSDIAQHKPNPQLRTVGSLFWKDGGQSQAAMPLTIGGKPFLVFTQELSSGGIGAAARAASCAQNLPPFGFPKLIDISDETHPKEAAKLMLEVDDPAYCSMTMGEATNPAFVYDSHYCNVDDPHDARLMVCSFFEAGLRAFDVRDPYHPREVAYYKPPAQGTKDLPGSNLQKFTGNGGVTLNRTADWASSFLRILKRKDGQVEVWFTSHDNGFQVVRFTNPAQVGADLLATKPGDDVM
ncbi:MAG: LVIVD repeat-containing protein [Janthinobacterium lividum]